MSGARKFCSPGFTLVELLVVVSLLAMVGTVIFSGIAVGVRVWKNVMTRSEESRMILFWKQFQKDLVNQKRFSRIGFQGDEGTVSFVHGIGIKDEVTGLVHEEIGRIKYYFDKASDSFCKEALPYLEIQQGTKADCLAVLTNVKALHLEYYGSPRSSAPMSWQARWDGEKIPAAVRLKLTLLERKDEKQFTILLPLGL